MVASLPQPREQLRVAVVVGELLEANPVWQRAVLQKASSL
eukprot:CAMPEP_0175286436 /NCGR_PEP_ID=MMETSP0093-20121207/53760_1 /TAXON_ID=311494 /ORGANISM="Alexandrium monilatum, Strain CCMP3105" /LENGTH=39 /DNA_ID= /DNA_START= /DNA_END= /DNA_ORIENTATION=